MLQVVCVDYPRPDLDNSVNFLEVALLSSSFRSSLRPSKPLKVVIAGAGDETLSFFLDEKTLWVNNLDFDLYKKISLTYSHHI
jgi:hypothetical protein